MPREKSKKQEKSIFLLQTLQNEAVLSIQDIMQLLDCNRPSAYNYIKYLSEQGISLQKEVRQKKTYISLSKDSISNVPSSAEDSLSYLPVTGKVLYKYDIIKTLYHGPATADMLIKNGISESYLYKLLSELLEENEIFKKETLYFLNTETRSPTLSLSDVEIRKTALSLSNIPQGHPYYQPLNSIHNKINLTLGNIDVDDQNMNHYIIYGRKQFAFDMIQNELKKLNGFDYTHKVLQIYYLTNAGIERTVLFAVGMVVYALEKDTLYLMGKNYDADETYYMLIKLNQVIHIEETQKEHTHFNSMEFQEIYNTMFSISTEDAVDVVVEFADIFNIRRKLKQLCSQRPTAKRLLYNREEKTIIYRDTIRGLSDFANYLRRFGRGCRVLEPQELKDMMAFTVERSLQRYFEEEESHG